MTGTDARAALAEALDGQADWRVTKADAYPDDTRNANWADTAEACARYVELLQADDPRVLSIAASAMWDGSDLLSLGVDGSRFAGRCDLEPSAFLSELAQVMEDEAAREFSEDVERTDDEDADSNT